MTNIVKELQAVLGTDAVIPGDQLDRPTSYWNSVPVSALALVRPSSTEAMSQALTICSQHQQTIVTQGGMTNCVNAADSRENEVIISLERMAKIESIDRAGATATVGAGVILQVLQEACIENDLIFPLDLGARGSCTLGGNVATNAGGINVLRYGMMRELVLGMEVVLADGTVLSTMNQMLKNNAAYDLKQLFIGSEGTLGIVTRVVVKLFPKPKSCNTALLALDTFEQASTLLQHLKGDLAGTLSAYEIMWGNYYQAVCSEGGHRAPMSRDYPYYVIVEAEGADPEGDTQRFNHLLEGALEDGLIVDAVVPKSEAERQAVWAIREDFEQIVEVEPTFLYDVSLRIKDMPAYIANVKRALINRWPNSVCYVFGHMGDGNLHLFISPEVKGDRAQLHEECDREVYTALKPFKGSVSAEHGIGLEKKQWLNHCRSESELALMRTLKNTLDPQGLLNAGRVLEGT